tara:strand:- start:1013 stop:1432 length:420 start_codon:yes stop_codon:yes gene_type:complete
MANQNVTYDVASAVPYAVNLNIYGGASFSDTFTIINPDQSAFRFNTGAGSTAGLGVTWTGSAAISKSVAVGATLGVTETFTVGFTSAAGGVMTLSMGSTETRNLKPGRYVYDVLVSSGNTIYNIINGNVLVTAGIATAP